MTLGWRNAARNSRDGFVHAITQRSIRQETIVLALGTLVAPFVAADARHAVLLIAAVLLVLIVELLNNGIEAVCDRVTVERDPLIKIAKDSGSAAVTLSIVLGLLLWAEAAWSALA